MTCNLLLFKQDNLILLRTEPWAIAPGPAPALILPDIFAGLQEFADSVGPLAPASKVERTPRLRRLPDLSLGKLKYEAVIHLVSTDHQISTELLSGRPVTNDHGGQDSQTPI